MLILESAKIRGKTVLVNLFPRLTLRLQGEFRLVSLDLLETLGTNSRDPAMDRNSPQGATARLGRGNLDGMAVLVTADTEPFLDARHCSKSFVYMSIN